MRLIHRRDKAGLDPVRLATDMEVAWAAGVYEGEGNCSRSGHGSKSFVAQMAQKDPELLYRLRDLFGGRVQEYHRDGTNLLPRKPYTIFDWKVCGDRARMFLTAIYPFLTARRKAQIDCTSVLHFREFVGELPGSDIMVFLNEKLKQWIETRRLEARERIRENYHRYYDKNRDNEEHVAHRREVRRLQRERKRLAANSKEGM